MLPLTRRFAALLRTSAPLRALCSALHPPSTLPASPTRYDPRAERAEKLAVSRAAADRAEAFELACAAADAGCLRSLAMKGAFLERGCGCDVDRGLGRELMLAAAQRGEPWGMMLYGTSLLSADEPQGADEATLVTDGDGRSVVHVQGAPADTPADVARRARKARRAAGFRDDEGREYEAMIAQRRVAERDSARTAGEAWLDEAAKRGIDAAMVMMGNKLLERGEAAAAVQWYERAIKEARNTDAYYNLGVILEEGRDNVNADVQRSQQCFAMAAQLGDAAAQCHMAQAYRDGTFEREGDVSAARSYAEQAAAQGNARALYMLADMHRAGEAGLEKDDKRYVRYLMAAADGELPDAVAELADLRYKGEAGVARDEARALAGFRRAGELGHTDALCSAAAMLYHGRGAEKDAHQAFLLYQQAASMGSEPAMRNVGAMYFRGDGVPKNLPMAEMFFKMADQTAASRKSAAYRSMSGPAHTADAPPHPMIETSDAGAGAPHKAGA